MINITITIKEDTDFDGNAYSYKFAEAELDGISLNSTYTAETSVSDEDIESAFKDQLSGIGYTIS